jgi:uncharacterized membrane protein
MAQSVNELHQLSLRWHEKLAVKIVGFVGSILGACLFAAITLISLPSVLATGSILVFIAWLTQSFLSLVLLSIIMMGQNLQQRHAEILADETYRNVLRDEQETESVHRKLDKLLSMVEE